jgi:hypothetical protein
LTSEFTHGLPTTYQFNQTKPNQTKPDNKLNQTKPNQTKPKQSQFVVVTMWVGYLGVQPLAAHTAMLNLFVTATCGMYGFGDACSARVGAFLGGGDTTRAVRFS